MEIPEHYITEGLRDIPVTEQLEVPPLRQRQEVQIPEMEEEVELTLPLLRRLLLMLAVQLEEQEARDLFQ
jgi:hypothetical protein